MKKKVKFLCVCNQGNVRSSSMAWELKNRCYEALSIGIQKEGKDWNRNDWGGFSNSTIKILVDWADIILDLSTQDSERLKPYKLKVKKINIGEDVWKNPTNEDLREKIKKILDKNLGNWIQEVSK